MDLFSQSQKSDESLLNSPLAERLRPKSVASISGQESQIGPNSALINLLKRGHVPSLIIWGPPGCGKTTFARALSLQLDREVISVNAIDTGAKKLKEIGEDCRNQRKYHGHRPLLFIDEIHRLNKAQQDVLLPYIESGDVTLIGATTENPSFEINPALLSRCRLLVFERLSEKDLQKIAIEAFQNLNVEKESVVHADAFEGLIGNADGDARKLLNRIEELVELFQAEDKSFSFPLVVSDLPLALGGKTFNYVKKGDERSHLISAFIKSIRGSDSDGGLYYLARLITSGEDVNFIARRLMILASEDVGNADPQGLVVATSAQQACHQVGLPEAGIILAQVVTYLASAPKSNRSYEGFNRAMSEVKKTGSLPVPMTLRNAPTRMMKDLGYGKNYKYAHDSLIGFQEMTFLPEGVESKEYYVPSKRGHELKIRKYLEWLKENT